MTAHEPFDLKQVLEQIQDHLVPTLDVYEQALYVFIFRHSRLENRNEITLGFKSAARSLALGIGRRGKGWSETTLYEKLRSLHEKRAIEILATESSGTRLRVFIPSEIPGLIEPTQSHAEVKDESIDFFSIPENRKLIVEREGNRCFYCLRKLNKDSYVLEHVTSRPEGDHSFMNLVASCRSCNNRKGATTAEDHLRRLYRDEFLSEQDLAARLAALEQLRAGELKPMVHAAVRVPFSLPENNET